MAKSKTSKRQKEVLISDLSICQPKSAFAKSYVPGKWKLLDYEHDKFSGVMLGAIGSRDAQPIRLPLKLKGWYEIYVGLYPTYEQIGVRLRLSSERAYRKFLQPSMFGKDWFTVIVEHFWKAADLTGESIHIAPLKIFGEDVDNYVTYFRLVPMSKAKIAKVKKNRKDKDLKRLIAMNDGGIIPPFSISSDKEMAEEIDIYKDTDFGGVCWEMIKGRRPLFPVPGIKLRMFPPKAMIPHASGKEGRRVWAEKIHSGYNHLRVLRKLTRSAGMQLHISHRMCEAAQPPYEDFCRTDFLDGKYDWYCRHADGAPVPRYSYAKPIVRDHMIRIYAEAAKYGVDGFHMLTIRGGPMVLYEDEMIERFEEMYGRKVDPRTLPLSDNRVFKVRGQLFGEYLKMLRRAVNASARKAGHKRPMISIHGLNNFKACRHFGIDFASWAQQGLIDRIVACCWGEEWGGDSRFHWPEIDMAHYRRCVEGTKVQLFAQVPPPSSRLPKNPDTCADYYRRRAEKLYRQGAEGLYFWDTQWRHMNAEHFNVLSVLGHRRTLAREIETARKRTRQLTINKLIGLELDRERFPAWLGG